MALTKDRDKIIEIASTIMINNLIPYGDKSRIHDLGESTRRTIIQNSVKAGIEFFDEIDRQLKIK